MTRMVTVSFPDSTWRDEVGPIDGVTAVVWDPQEAPPQESVDVYIAPYMTKPAGVAVVAEQPSVRLVQLLSAGFDNMLPVLPEGVSLANAKGVHDAATAELALTLVLASQRGFDDFARAQAQGEWTARHVRLGLADKRVLIVGYGQIGEAIENIESGELTPLSVFSPERIEYLPDVPTATEQGLPVEVYQYRFMTVPKGTPQEVQDRLAEGMEETFATSEYQEFNEQNSLTPMEITGEEVVEQLELDNQRYADLIEKYDLDMGTE